MKAAIAVALAWSVSALVLAQGAQPPLPAAPVAAAATAATAGVHVLPVQRNVYLIASASGNVTAQVGADGVLLVDTMGAALAPQVLAAVRTLTDKPIHTIVNTDLHPEHTGGNDVVIAQRGAGGVQPVKVIAHENVLNRMMTAASRAPGLPLNAVISLPINSEYFTPTRDFYLNGEAIILNHAPAAHTDGDTMVYFRGSDVLSMGDLFTPDLYPVIDLQNGGSVQGIIAALNRALEITVPARYQEGGTYVIPGRGRLCDEAEVVEYRDMVTIIRDRVQALIARGLSLRQVQDARPSRDYDTEYGATTGPWTSAMFVEAVYRSLGGKT